jgi:5-formyltetrahydrofolate cyclo-ligase
LSEGAHDTGFASPPCFAHELALGDEGVEVVDAETARDVARWRKATREQLIAARLEIPAAERQRCADEIAVELDRLVGSTPGRVVAVYWPFRGELDLRRWMARKTMRGVHIALPVVKAKGQPLVFRELRSDSRLERGIWNIPIPSDGRDFSPDVVIAPLVGYDLAGYRLGYGGGFYDRTLAALLPRPPVIGVAHPVAALKTIWPQPHDIPMDVIVTGAGRVWRRGETT